MTEIPATYFDGRTSQPQPVRLRWLADTAELEVIGPHFTNRLPRKDLTIESRLGRAPRFIRLASGGRFEVPDNAGLDAAMATWDQRASTWLHRVENNWGLVAVAVVVLVGLGWVAVHFGLPWAARRVAFALPAGITHQLGEQTLATLDRVMFEPSKLTPERQLELQEKFKRFLAATGDTARYRIEFRNAPAIKANALALPSGTIIITDDLVFLAEDDNELIGVLAHECGHIRFRHALRGMLQNSAVFVVIALVTGDVSSATVFGGALPAYLLQNRFSREFESEADEHAVRQLRAARIPPEHLATMLERLGRSHGEVNSKMLDYMRSHPSTPDRIERIKRDGGR